MADRLQQEWVTFRKTLVDLWMCHAYPTPEQLSKADRLLNQVVPACEQGPLDPGDECECYRCVRDRTVPPHWMGELTTEVLDRWAGCDREEAIRQCEIQYAEREKWQRLFDQVRGERDAANAKVAQLQLLVREAWGVVDMADRASRMIEPRDGLVDELQQAAGITMEGGVGRDRF